MGKKILLFILALLAFNTVSFAANNKIAIVDVEKVVNKSAQVQNLKRSQEIMNKEITYFIEKSNKEIQQQTDATKQKVLADKYTKELKAKQSANTKAYKTKLEAIDKSINATIAQQAKAMGYDIVLTKGVVLYGGDDITEAILKVVK